MVGEGWVAAPQWSMWQDLVDCGGRRCCESDLVAYGDLVVVEGQRKVGLDWRSHA